MRIAQVAHGTKRLQLFPPSDMEFMYPFPSPKYHSSAVAPFTAPTNAPPEFEHYKNARPIDISLKQGEMLYLPAYWYHCVQGGDGFNVLLAWWTDIHPRKHDDAGSDEFEEARRADPEDARRFTRSAPGASP